MANGIGSLSYISMHTSHNKGTAANGRAGRKNDVRPIDRILTARLTAAALFFLIIFTGFAIVQSGASGTRAETAANGERTIVVSSGDTLWDIAQSVKPEGGDVRKTVYMIKKRNNLSGSVLQPGQSLIVPAK